jgi:hypothetical protein
MRKCNAAKKTRQRINKKLSKKEKERREKQNQWKSMTPTSRR